MSQIDWAKKYAAMDQRIFWKYQELPDGEQIGKRRVARDSKAERDSIKAAARN
jgi:hypothetical protein